MFPRFSVVAGDCRIDQSSRLNFRVLLLQINIYHLSADVSAYRILYFNVTQQHLPFFPVEIET